MADSAPFLVVGLGNPGDTYNSTRHNIGFELLDDFIKELNTSWKLNKKTNAVETSVNISGRKLILLKPQTFMNNSGQAVNLTMKYYSIPLENLIVIHDELDIDFTKVRLKKGGGEGGHNGLRSITQHLGSKDYLRIRLGIGRPPGKMDAATYVLKKFSSNERQELPFIFAKGEEAIDLLLTRDLSTAQNRIHGEA